MLAIKDTRLADALNAMRQALGNEHVVTDFLKRQEYQTTTYQTAFKIPAIVFPGSLEEVQACVRIANSAKTPIYPISTGKNYGYGSRVPSSERCIVLELSRMKRIIDYSEDLGTVTVEPGVTQRQLSEFLMARGNRFWMDATGSSPDHSLIGNLAERGFGHTPYGDHFGNVGEMEVVLPQGDCIHTGFGRFPNARAKGYYRWGLGPSVDGLFTQSNFGIITRATLWLMPAPACHQYFYFSFERSEQLGEIIDLLRPLRLAGTLKSAIHIANDYKVISSLQGYPWEKMAHHTPLSSEVMQEAVRIWDIGAWNGYSALYGTRQEIASARKAVRRRLKGRTKKLVFIDDTLLKWVRRLAKPLSWIMGKNPADMIRSLEPVYKLTKGIPSEHFLWSAYWRKSGKLPTKADLDHDGCGLIWCAPIAPINGTDAAELRALILPIFDHFGFEPIMSITLLTERALSCVITISFDRTVPGEDQKALACHDSLLAVLTGAGFYPYRLSTHAMNLVKGTEPAFAEFQKCLKNALDPNGILAPGRYEI